MLTVVSPTARSEVNWRVTVSASTSYVTVTSVGRKGVGRKGVGRKGVGRRGNHLLIAVYILHYSIL